MPKAESSIVVANWMAFLALGASTVVLMISAFKYKGPVSTECISGHPALARPCPAGPRA